MKNLLPIFILPLVVAQAIAKPACPDDFPVVDKCFEVHGRLQISASLRPRIWHIGTNRILEVFWKDDDQNNGLTPEIAKVFRSDLEAKIFGDYLLCPIGRDVPGHMQFVCMAGAKHLMIVPSKQDESIKP